MPYFTEEFDVDANDQENDVLQGTRIARLPANTDHIVEVLATGSATGLEHELFVDQDSAIERSLVSSQNRVPLDPDDRVTRFAAEGGSRLQLNVTNTTGSGESYFVTIKTEAI